MWLKQIEIYSSYKIKSSEIKNCWCWFSKLRCQGLGSPGSSVVKTTPTNAGDTGSIPDPGRSHMLRCATTTEPMLSSLGNTATEPMCLESELCNKTVYHSEKPANHSWRASSACHSERQSLRSNKDPAQPVKKERKWYIYKDVKVFSRSLLAFPHGHKMAAVPIAITAKCGECTLWILCSSWKKSTGLFVRHHW